MMKRKYTFAALAAFAFMFASPALADLPRPTSATFAKGAKFTVEGYAADKPALTNFPVLVRIATNSLSRFHYSDMQHADATDKNDIDIAFINMDGSGLPFEIDTWNTNGTSLIWVTLPTMTNRTEFIMCWGSSSSGKVVSSANPWSDYTGVWHMNDPGDGSDESPVTILDSTANELNGTTKTGSAVALGKLGGARRIATDRANKHGIVVDIPLGSAKREAADALWKNFHASCWVHAAHSEMTYGFFVSRRKGEKGKGWGLRLKEKDTMQVYYGSGDVKKDTGANYGTLFNTAAGNWNKVDIVFRYDALSASGNRQAADIYLNGAYKESLTFGDDDIAQEESNIGIGCSAQDNPSDTNKGRRFNGEMDEVRLGAFVPSADWVAADYATQTDTSFLTPGTAEDYVENDNPHASVAVASVAYTNVTLTANVLDLGGDATSAGVSVSVSTDNQFTTDVWHTEYSVEAADNRSFDILHLLTNTTYHVRLIAENPLGGGVTNTVSFTTRTPGVPAGTALFLERGFSTLSARATAISFGSGAEGAIMRLEASADGFETIAASADVAATLNEQVELVVSNLTPGTEYALRVRIRNDWGIDTYIELPSAYTRTVPFATTGIGWTFSPDGSAVDISLGISGVYDYATGSATLTYNGADIGTKEVTGATTLTWPGLSAASGTAVATIVLSATLGGQSYSRTYAATIAPGSTAVSVSDVMKHVSAATAIRVHPGDVVTLPELTGTDSYILGNKLFGALDGNVLTALRPGILGIHCIANDGAATNTVAVLVLPDKIGDGNIYVLKEEDINNNSRYWNEASNWELLGSETNDSWPHDADDIAIVASYSCADIKLDLRDGGCVMGALYSGGYCDTAYSLTLLCNTKQNNVLLVSSVVVECTDDEPARIQLCPNSPVSGNNVFRAKLTIDQSIPSIAFHSDTIISGGSDSADATYPQGRFDFNAQLFNIAEGATVSLVEMDTHQTGSALATMTGGRLTGGGTFWNRSAAAVRFDRNKETFTGLLRDSGGYGHKNGDRCGPTEVRSISTNCTAEAVGWIGVDSSSQPRGGWNQSVGCIYLGNDHTHGATKNHAGTNWFPRVATLHGGRLELCPEQAVWGDPGVLDRKYAQRFVLADGFCYLRAWSRDTSKGSPVNWFEADELGHENKSTLRIDDDSRKSTASTATITNQATFLRGWASAAVGPAGDPESSDSYPTIPWIVSPLDGGYNTMYFSAFDSAGRLVRPALAANNTALSAFSAGRNAYCRNAGIALTEDLTVNSLYLQNDTKGKTLGAGMTLTVTSGGLILSDVNDNNNPGAAAIGEEGGAENGALILGNADHPAYVWAYGATTSSANTAPNQIWAEVTAPGGFVVAYTGHLILGGDQTGIGDEIAVNAGTLILGSSANSCQLAKDLPIRIFANATLKLPNASSTTGNILKFDGAAGWFGKVKVPSGVAAKCRKAYWRDYPETPEWQNLKRGVYTGDEATALANPKVVYDPEHFSGAGTIEVLRDDLAMPLVIRMK